MDFPHKFMIFFRGFTAFYGAKRARLTVEALLPRPLRV